MAPYKALPVRLSSTISLPPCPSYVPLGEGIRGVFTLGLRERLLEAWEQSGMTKADLARAMGVTPQSVGSYFKTGRISKDKLVLFASVTKYPLLKLLDAGNTYQDLNQGSAAHKVPLISWIQAGQRNPVADPFPPGAPEEWEEVTVPASKASFALRIRGDSMVAPDGSGFPEGSVIVVDPHLEARNGDYVVVRFQDSDEATFKRLVVDGPMKILKPLNPTYPNIPVTEDARLAGVVVEHRVSRRFR